MGLLKMCVSKYLDIVYKNGNFFICHRRTKIIVVRCLNLNALNQYISENIAIYGSFSDYEFQLTRSVGSVTLHIVYAKSHHHNRAEILLKIT